jgi:hypothetical protein
MQLTVFDCNGISATRRERIEAAVEAGGKHVAQPYEGWIAADPLRGGVRVLITGPQALKGRSRSPSTKLRRRSRSESGRRLKTDGGDSPKPADAERHWECRYPVSGLPACAGNPQTAEPRYRSWYRPNAPHQAQSPEHAGALLRMVLWETRRQSCFVIVAGRACRREGASVPPAEKRPEPCL